jgi:filamentous hemagglutinin family protein
MDESIARSRLPDSMKQAFLWALLPTLVLFLIAPSVGDAQQVVTTNITPSALPPCPGPCGPGVTIVAPPPTGGTVTTITGGARPGGGPNLFHSFGRFDVGPGDIANFFNDTHLPTSNILSRVTGGNQSQIYGTIRTTDFPGANLFLMNPAGVLFGATAVLDLGAVTGSAVRQPGSFYATTADYLNLGDANGTSPFYADPAQASVLSVAPVVAFGFLALEPGVTRGTISVQGSILEIPQGHSLSLVGGDIIVQSGTLADGTIQAASLRAPGGQINLVAVASPGEVLVPSFQPGPNIDGASFTGMGTVMLKEGATLDVSGQFDEFGTPIGNGNSGTVFVRGGQLVMDASAILANTVGSVDGASRAVDIQVSQDVALTNGSAIITLTLGPGRAGDVQLTAGTLTMENFALIKTNTLGGDGVGGDVVLNVGTLSLMDGSSIQSQSSSVTPGLGQGGNVTIQGLPGAEFGAAETVALSGGSKLVSETFGTGHGGGVAITSKSLTMDDFATVDALTHDVGSGGDIVVSLQHASLSGGATIATHTTSGEPNAAAGGTVTVQGLGEPKAVSVALSGFGSGIVSETSGTARSGDIAVHAKRVSLTDGAVIQTGFPEAIGTAGNVTIDADSVDISGGSTIMSLSAAGNAGQVAITANTLTLDNAFIEADTSSDGRGGDVVLKVGTVSLTNGASINSQTFSTGRAGDITMTGGSLTLANHAEITSSSMGTEVDSGDAGSVTITSSGAFTSDASTIATSAENARGGDIDVTAHSVTLSNGTVISASSRSPLLPDGGGNAGNITIHSGSTFVMNNSSMTTEASQASGGQIEINAPEMVQLINSRISTSVAGSATDTAGGNIKIDPQFVILQNSQILAQAFAGSGGKIDIISGVFPFRDPSSQIDASSTLGISGTVTISAPGENVGGQLTPMSQQFSSAAALLAQRCAARVADGKFSTFVVAGREGLPVEPGGFLASPSLTAELLGSSLSGRDRHTQFPAVTGAFHDYDVRPIQLAKYGDACR